MKPLELLLLLLLTFSLAHFFFARKKGQNGSHSALYENNNNKKTRNILQFQESVDQEELVIYFTSVEKTHQFQYILIKYK